MDKLQSNSNELFDSTIPGIDTLIHTRLIEEVEDYAIIFLSIDGIIKSWNVGAQKIKGYKSDEIIGKHFSIFYRPQDRESKLPETLLNLAAGKGKASHEGWRVHKNGEQFWGSITITALHDDNGSLIGFSKVTRDLTERKHREDELEKLTEELRLSNQELKNSEERYHRMISDVEDYAIILLDINGNILNWNLGAQKIKGYSASEIIGKNFRIFYQPHDRETGLPEQLINRSAKEGKAQHEGWRVRKDGTRFWGNILITALHDEAGGLIGFSKVTRDLTERKITEDKMRNYLLELESQNIQLEQFSYIASHDLQEPLRKARTFIDLIKNNFHNKELVSRYFEKIELTLERMTQQIQGILQYSRISNESTEKGVVDVNEILNGVVTDFELLIQERNARIQTGRLKKIIGNGMQIRQLMINLLGNAIKFCLDEPVISISSRIVNKSELSETAAELTENKYVEIAISDNGIGFEKEYEKQIFLLFQRLHSRHKYPGTGIGLTICKKIMDNHKGAIIASGGNGNGATFYLYFPYYNIED